MVLTSTCNRPNGLCFVLEVRKLLRADLPSILESLSKLVLEPFSGSKANFAFRVQGIAAAVVIATMARVSGVVADVPTRVI